MRRQSRKRWGFTLVFTVEIDITIGRFRRKSLKIAKEIVVTSWIALCPVGMIFCFELATETNKLHILYLEPSADHLSLWTSYWRLARTYNLSYWPIVCLQPKRQGIDT
jgi:hypothetical protein